MFFFSGGNDDITNTIDNTNDAGLPNASAGKNSFRIFSVQFGLKNVLFFSGGNDDITNSIDNTNDAGLPDNVSEAGGKNSLRIFSVQFGLENVFFSGDDDDDGNKDSVRNHAVPSKDIGNRLKEHCHAVKE